MDKNQLDDARLDFDLATTPERKIAWAERWGKILLRDIEDALAGEGDYERSDYEF